MNLRNLVNALVAVGMVLALTVGGELSVKKESKGLDSAETIDVGLSSMWKAAEDTGADLSAAVLLVSAGSRVVCKSLPKDKTAVCKISLREITTLPQNGDSRDYVDLTFTIATGPEERELYKRKLRVHITADAEDDLQQRSKRRPLRLHRALLLTGGGAALAGGLRGLYVHRKDFRSVFDPLLEVCAVWRIESVSPLLAALARGGGRVVRALRSCSNRLLEQCSSALEACADWKTSSVDPLLAALGRGGGQVIRALRSCSRHVLGTLSGQCSSAFEACSRTVEGVKRRYWHIYAPEETVVVNRSASRGGGGGLVAKLLFFLATVATGALALINSRIPDSVGQAVPAATRRSIFR